MKGNLSKYKFVKLTELNQQKWLDFIEKSFDYQNPKGFKKIIWSKTFFIFSWFLSIFPGIIMMILRRNKINKMFAGFMNKRFAFFQAWFNQYFEDIQVTKRPNEQKFMALAKQTRGTSIPKDATIHEWSNGYTFVNKEGSEINVAGIKWKWVRHNGKHTQTYYRRKLYAWITTKSPKWTKLHFSLTPDTIFKKTKSALENEQFNKKWIYKSNDPVKIRMLLTPATQEDILNKLGKIKKGKTFSFTKKDENFLMSITYPLKFNPFLVNVPNTVNLLKKEEIVKSVYEDSIRDLAQVQDWLKIIGIFRSLF